MIFFITKQRAPFDRTSLQRVAFVSTHCKPFVFTYDCYGYSDEPSLYIRLPFTNVNIYQRSSSQIWQYIEKLEAPLKVRGQCSRISEVEKIHCPFLRSGRHFSVVARDCHSNASRFKRCWTWNNDDRFWFVLFFRSLEVMASFNVGKYSEFKRTGIVTSLFREFSTITENI